MPSVGDAVRQVEAMPAPQFLPGRAVHSGQHEHQVQVGIEGGEGLQRPAEHGAPEQVLELLGQRTTDAGAAASGHDDRAALHGA